MNDDLGKCYSVCHEQDGNDLALISYPTYPSYVRTIWYNSYPLGTTHQKRTLDN